MYNTIESANVSKACASASTGQKIRVLFISHTYVVGVNQGKLKAIADTGLVEVGLLAPSNWQALEWKRIIELETPFSEIKTYSAPVWFSGRVGAHLYHPWKIWQVINDFKPDVIQVEEEIFSLCAFEAAFWARLFRKPMVVFGWENQLRSLSLFRRWIRNFVMGVSKLYLAGNQDGAEVMRSWNYQGQIEVMPQMGVDTKLFTPLARKSPQDQINIGFLGRLVPEKGLDILFTAVRQLQEQDLDFQVTLCGSGESEADLRQKAEILQINERLIWRGAVRHEAAPKELGKFDVLVLPSRTVATWKEQFGHVIIEAMAMGIPVVGSSCGEIPHVIARDDLVFPEGDSVALAKILKRLICDRNWREEMGNYGIERVKHYYSHERIAQRLVEQWQKLISTLK
ncbi:glycosyl transferase group 1 [Pleurocapsa sp. CCALA 161]|uniref:glycosyltransferase n=1 Tax=Pleurocapsa sp. CCALA 161 TaxID=2107688 RepID=UPI000D077CB3|nr:glycosyltransferase [Pleurocapsa sp. CCALA 161]PSB06682.1 glycosyl transferase group 1 [Pleurocapsa sp. CCALA 161]